MAPPVPARAAGADPFLTARWESLLMVNYEVPREVLLPLVPAGVELDPPDGPVLASLVGFLFLDTRLKGWTVPFHRDFEEVNLRFYVRRPTPEGWRRGVVFVKEIVPRWTLAAVARMAYGERYASHPMRHRRDAESVEYAWRAGGRWHAMSARLEGPPEVPPEGSHERFVTDHLWGYVSPRRRLRAGGAGGAGEGAAVEYEVRHPPWRVWRARDVRVDVDAAAVYGPAFGEALARRPVSAFVAEGSPVEVYPGRAVAPAEPGRI